MKRSGIEYVRGYDLTRGRAGWHPHIHVALLIGPGQDAAAVAGAFVSRWRFVLSQLGAEALPSGLDAQRASSAPAAAVYAMTLTGQAKASRGADAVVAEATAAAGKRGRRLGGRTSRDLAEAAVAGDRSAAAAWTEFAQATKGRRAVVVSQGLRLSNEAEAAGAGDGDGEVIDPEVVAYLVGEGLWRIDPHLPAVLRAARVSVAAGRAAIGAVLGEPGRHWTPDPPPSDGVRRRSPPGEPTE